jgi:DNA repair protein RadD
MILRPRQQAFKKKCLAALKKRGNTLGIAPTGAGKTVMLSAVAGEGDGSVLVLQHRAELVEQNERTFRAVNPGRGTSFYTADYKRWGQPGSATFAMVQTLSRDSNLATMPAMDMLVIDEAHHAASDSYIKLIDRAVSINPKVRLFGVTATPARGDSRNLRATFDNVADQITLGELIREGNLVKPRCFVIETGTKEQLAGVRKTPSDFDMTEVESIMNTRVINEKVVEKWREHAGDRRTVVFASTVQHASDITAAFAEAGVSVCMVHGSMGDRERADTLAAFDRGQYQVVVNVMVLTEGWDCQPVSCVVLLRPCSFKSTMIQMVGRGLRRLDPERYPGITKDDCVVLDFGYTLLTHRDLEQQPTIETDEGPKSCPECDAIVPAAVIECPICGHEWPRPDTEEDSDSEGSATREDRVLEDFVMTEVDLLAKSPFRWEGLFDGAVTITTGFSAWAAAVLFRGRWVAVCGSRFIGMKVVADSHDRLMAMAAADDFMREHEDADAVRKTKRWLSLPPTDKQVNKLGLNPMSAMGWTRYRASCAIQWTVMEGAIKNKLMRLAPPQGAMA